MLVPYLWEDRASTLFPNQQACSILKESIKDMRSQIPQTKVQVMYFKIKPENTIGLLSLESVLKHKVSADIDE